MRIYVPLILAWIGGFFAHITWTSFRTLWKDAQLSKDVKSDILGE